MRDTIENSYEKHEHIERFSNEFTLLSKAG
jgi:hypothetical protein